MDRQGDLDGDPRGLSPGSDEPSSSTDLPAAGDRDAVSRLLDLARDGTREIARLERLRLEILRSLEDGDCPRMREMLDRVDGLIADFDRELEEVRRTREGRGYGGGRRPRGWLSGSAEPVAGRPESRLGRSSATDRDDALARPIDEAVGLAVDRVFWANVIEDAARDFCRERYPEPPDEGELFEYLEPPARRLGVDTDDFGYGCVVSAAVMEAETAFRVDQFDEGDPEQREAARRFFCARPSTGTLFEIRRPDLRRSAHRHLLGQIRSRARAPRIGGSRRRGSRRAAGVRSGQDPGDPDDGDPQPVGVPPSLPADPRGTA